MTTLQHDFAAELNRLLASGLTPEQEVIARRYYSDKERKSMDADQFCGPHKSFPITSQEDVNNAAHLIGKADNPAAVKACIKGKAKANGWSIPDAWQDEDTKAEERYMTSTLDRAATNHEPFTGVHSHPHDANGAQGDDETHSHEHSHDNDNTHDHDHAERVAASGTIQVSDRHVMSLPLVRIDATKREVWGQATAEVPDSYGTIFGYCPDAWTQWRGNIREQHDPKKAVGKAVEINPDPQERAIYVGSRVSRGAQDTWLKVEDNVLTGYSASIIPDPEYGTDPKRWPMKEYNGKQYPYLPRYTVAELSLVDNPACPGCNIQIVRADGFATDVLDLSEEETPTIHPESAASSSSLSRAGARISSETKSAMHSGIGHTLKAAMSQMQNCGCEDCQAAMKMIDPDHDGDIDMGGYDDPDSDWQSLYSGGDDGDMERKLSGLIERVLDARLHTVYARLQGIAGTLARVHAAPTEASLHTLISGAIERAVASANEANASSLSEVRADVSAVKATVERIENTPMPGAPIQNAGSLPRPVEKRLATDPYRMPNSAGATADAVAALFNAGQLNTTEKQVDAVAAALAAQRKGR